MSTTTIPTSHRAVYTPAKRAPLVIKHVPTRPPSAGEVLVRVGWTGCTPLDLHQADGALLSTGPRILGDSFSGVVVALGPAGQETDEQPLQIGDHVAGFAWQQEWHNAWQTHVTVPRNLLSRVPPNISLQAAAAVPSSSVTAVHTARSELGLDLPWPIPANWQPSESKTPILLWGASGSVGTYMLQVLRHWGYTRLLAVASARNHDKLREFGASVCFDYADEDVCEQIIAAEPNIPYIVDCIGSMDKTLRPLTKIARRGAKVAVMMPVIVRDATVDQEPLYAMSAKECHEGEWNDGVELIDVRTHYYQNVSTSPGTTFD